MSHPRTAAQREQHRQQERARLARRTSDQIVRERERRSAYYLAHKKPYVPTGRYRKDPGPVLDKDTCLYLAGLFDGEGSFTINATVDRRGGAKYNAKIRIGMSHKPTIEWVAGKLNRTVQRHVLSRRAAPNSKPIFRISIDNAAAIIGLIEQLLPYLITKHDAADTVLAFCRSRLVSGRMSNTERQYTTTDVSLVQRIKEINRFGRTPEQKVAV
jgi:hypothetical protein